MTYPGNTGSINREIRLANTHASTHELENRCFIYSRGKNPKRFCFRLAVVVNLRVTLRKRKAHKIRNPNCVQTQQWHRRRSDATTKFSVYLANAHRKNSDQLTGNSPSNATLTSSSNQASLNPKPPLSFRSYNTLMRYSPIQRNELGTILTVPKSSFPIQIPSLIPLSLTCSRFSPIPFIRGFRIPVKVFIRFILMCLIKFRRMRLILLRN